MTDLYSLETYASVRKDFRAKVIAHKKLRLVELGAHASLHFEDRLTMQYQVQEMLRLERIFEPELIQEELDVYNPLIPDGSNWKATLMFEYPDAEERTQALARLVGVETCDLCAGRGLRPRHALRQRGSRPVDRGEDVGGAFPALRADAGHGRGGEGGRGDPRRRRPSALQGGDHARRTRRANSLAMDLR